MKFLGEKKLLTETHGHMNSSCIQSAISSVMILGKYRTCDGRSTGLHRIKTDKRLVKYPIFSRLNTLPEAPSPIITIFSCLSGASSSESDMIRYYLRTTYEGKSKYFSTEILTCQSPSILENYLHPVGLPRDMSFCIFPLGSILLVFILQLPIIKII